MHDHDVAPPPPEELFGGRYRLEDELGRGGMGVVHRAWDVRLDRPVAVKILRNASGRARFRVEGQTLSRLSHPGLVTIHDADIAHDEPYLVMELVDGGPLTDRIRGHRSSPAEVQIIGIDVAEALAHVHSHRIVHRDVKPANILVGRHGRVKLADFGVARLLDGLTRHTDTGMIMGTAAYLSPEQVRGEAVTVASDVYSLGLVLIEALTGTPEFGGPWPESAVARLTRSPVIDPAWPAPLAALLAGMTAADPAQRPTAAEVAATLRSLPAAGWAARPASVPGPATEPLSNDDDTRATDAVTATDAVMVPAAVPGPVAAFPMAEPVVTPDRIFASSLVPSPVPVPSPRRWPDAVRSHARPGALVAAALSVPVLLLGLHFGPGGAFGSTDTGKETVSTPQIGTTPSSENETSVDGVSTKNVSASFTAARTSGSKPAVSSKHKKVVRKKAAAPAAAHRKAPARPKAARAAAPAGPGRGPAAGPAGPGHAGP